MSNSKGKCKVSSRWLHTWHLISKHMVRNGFPCNRNSQIHWQLPVFTEQISFLSICSVSGHRSETQRHLRWCEVSTERWQLGVGTQPQTKQNFGRHSKLTATMKAQTFEVWRPLMSVKPFADRLWNNGHCQSIQLKSSRAKPHRWTSFSKCRQLLYDVGLIWD